MRQLKHEARRAQSEATTVQTSIVAREIARCVTPERERARTATALFTGARSRVSSRMLVAEQKRRHMKEASYSGWWRAPVIVSQLQLQALAGRRPRPHSAGQQPMPSAVCVLKDSMSVLLASYRYHKRI